MLQDEGMILSVLDSKDFYFICLSDALLFIQVGVSLLYLCPLDSIRSKMQKGRYTTVQFQEELQRIGILNAPQGFIFFLQQQSGEIHHSGVGDLSLQTKSECSATFSLTVSPVVREIQYLVFTSRHCSRFFFSLMSGNMTHNPRISIRQKSKESKQHRFSAVLNKPKNVDDVAEQAQW